MYYLLLRIGIIFYLMSLLKESVAATVVEGIPGKTGAATVINFTDLAGNKSNGTKSIKRPKTHHRKIFRSKFGTNYPGAQIPTSGNSSILSPQKLLLSPGSLNSFLALTDNNTVIPPDTQGTVGPNHIMTALNSQVRIQNKSGLLINTIALSSFWAAVNGTNAFDPRVIYDPFNNRWIFSAATDAPDPTENISGATSSILLAVSENSDPAGNWFLYRIDADSANTSWADYPSIGFNKDWIVVSANMFPILSGTEFVNIYVFNKTNLYSHGTGSYTFLQDTSGSGFTLVPSVTYDNSLSTEYLVEDFNNLSGKLRISTITGPFGSEALTLGKAFPTAPTQWDFGGENNFLPQLGSAQKLDRGDSRILNSVYRNGKLWAAHTIFIPATNPNRAAVQWWQIFTGGEVQQVGRIDDTNGINFYAYPTIGVNSNDDVLIGYSRFSTNQYASANYSFRFGTDPPNTLRDDTVLKAGDGIYFKTLGSGVNRWGDYSATAVDPSDDLTLWTIQEYAAAPVGNPQLDNSGRWSTWWGKIDATPNILVSRASLVSEGCLPTNGVIDPGETVTMNFTFKNSGWRAVSNLTATLQNSGGISVSGNSSQNYGFIPAGSSASRTFTFTAGGFCGGTVVGNFTLQDGTNILNPISNSLSLGQPRIALSENFDGASPPAVPTGWTTNSGVMFPWRTVTNLSDTASNSIFATNRTTMSDNRLTSPTFSISATNALVTFRHNYSLEGSGNGVTGFDGGVLEISTNAGASFSDVLAAGGSFLTNGYNRTISTNFGNPLAGRLAWSGSSGGWITTTANLPASASGKQVQLRWRCGTDNAGGLIGWYVDSINVVDGYSCCVSPPIIFNPKASGTNIIFLFPSVSGQTYIVEFKNFLTNQNWTVLQTIIGDGSIKFVTNGVSSQRYYRIHSP